MNRSHITSVIPLLSQGEEPKFQEKTLVINEKKRVIAVPNAAMRTIHANLLKRLLFLPVDFSTATGGVCNSSSVENAFRHLGSRYFYQLDIRNAYPSIQINRLAQVLAQLDPQLGSNTAIEKFLQTYCSSKSGGLAVGGPASQLLFNIYCSETIDRQLRDLIRPQNILTETRDVLTRYVDDIIFSSTSKIPRIFRRHIRDIVESAGFEINHQKSKVLNIRNPARPIVVTGVVITKDGKLSPEESFMDKVEELLDREPGGLTDKELDRLSGFLGYLKSFPRNYWKNETLTARTENLIERCSLRLEEYREVSGKGTWQHPSQACDSMLPQSFIDEVKSEAEMKEIIEPYIRKHHKKGWKGEGLKKTGGEYKGLCPFHREKSPSFTVAQEKGFYHCFGCGAHGSIFDFLMDKRGISFREAVLEVATLYGIPSPEQCRLKL
ncbi:CHC2 zinc finger domain-containing protein [candidate division KSB1 bacterium]